jgi:hypothetical protein
VLPKTMYMFSNTRLSQPRYHSRDVVVKSVHCIGVLSSVTFCFSDIGLLCLEELCFWEICLARSTDVSWQATSKYRCQTLTLENRLQAWFSVQILLLVCGCFVRTSPPRFQRLTQSCFLLQCSCIRYSVRQIYE